MRYRRKFSYLDFLARFMGFPEVANDNYVGMSASELAFERKGP